jgi:hypothetical protein
LRSETLTPPHRPVPSHPRPIRIPLGLWAQGLSRQLLHGLLILAIVAGGFSLAVPRALAAEILSIRSATLLQVGDQNRSYGVQLACVMVSDAQRQEALNWLQQHGARGTKVNLRPISQSEGRLVAKVSVLKTGLDLGDAMVSRGLASPVPCLQGEDES